VVRLGGDELVEDEARARDVSVLHCPLDLRRPQFLSYRHLLS